MKSITNEAAGRDLSYAETVSQIGLSTMMSVGWQRQTVVSAGDWFKVKVSRKYWLIIKLNGQDLYDVEVGRMGRYEGLPEYQPLEQRFDVPAVYLSQMVRELGDRA